MSGEIEPATPRDELTPNERAEIDRLLGVVPRVESRCHVCCEVESRDLVNRLIAIGTVNREIVHACTGINKRRLDEGDDRLITARSVWHHRRTHFNVDMPAQNLYRQIVERRAEEVGRDYVNGVGHALTPYAVIETAMVKGYEHIVDDSSIVSVKDALAAAAKLHEMSSQDAESRSRAQMLAQLERIISAAQELVPPERMDEFIERIGGTAVARREIVDAESSELPVSEVREFTPAISIDEDDVI